MKILRCAGPLVPLVGVLCVLLVVPAVRVDAQGVELSGAVKAVRQAENVTNDREVKDSLGEVGKALKRAEKLAAKGQAGLLLDEITAARRTLVGLLDETDTASSPAAPSIERAVGLIDDAIRTAGGYHASTEPCASTYPKTSGSATPSRAPSRSSRPAPRPRSAGATVPP